MKINKNIKKIEHILNDSIWLIYDNLYKNILDTKYNNKQKLRLYILHVKLILENLSIYKLNKKEIVRIKNKKDSINILIERIIKIIYYKFYIFKEDILQIIEIEKSNLNI